MGAAARKRNSVLTVRQLLAAILFVAIIAMAVRQPADSDTWWHLKSGQLLWESGQILRADPFSYTAQGQPWINHGWLVQILLWPLYAASGLAGLAVLLAALVTVSIRFVPLLIVMMVSVPAVLLNPNTIKMLPYAYQTISIGQLQDSIQEWAAPDFHNLQFHPFIWLLLLTLGAIGLSRRRADWTDLALVGLFGYMGLVAVRNIALFALVAPPVLSRHSVFVIDDLVVSTPRLSWLAALTHTRPSSRPRRALIWLNFLLLALVIIGAGSKIIVDMIHLQEPGIWGQGLPLEAAEYLRNHDLPGQMFNSYSRGGYLIWRLYPEKPVFIDGRTDLYALNGTVLGDYSQVHWVRPGWEQIMDEYGIGYVIARCTGLLDTMLAGTSGWQGVYRDETAAVYVRTRGIQ